MSALLLPLACISPALPAAPPAALAQETLRYIVPAPGEAMRSPRTRALSLAADPPDDLTVEFEPNGEWTRFGQRRYGDPGTTRVAFALDRAETGRLDLYVDLNRDRRLTTNERVGAAVSVGAGQRWETPLDLVLDDGEGDTVSMTRNVVFEMGVTGTVFGMATMGYLEGTVDLDGEAVLARRRDADANGCFGDPADHLWLDRDRDGFWAPLRELYVTQPILNLPAAQESGDRVVRYAVRSSRAGDNLRFDVIDGTGTVKLTLPHPSGEGLRTDIAEASVVLVGRDGSTVRVDGSQAGTELPVGDYRITSLSLRLEAAERGQVWSYLFSTAFKPAEADWTSVSKGAVWEFDPLGELDFQLEIVAPKGAAKPGGRIIAQPYLYTEGRLLIRNVYRGWDAPSWNGHRGATLRLVGDNAKLISQANSGFA